MHTDRISLNKGRRKFWFYVRNFASYALVPDGLYRWWFFRKMKSLTKEEMFIVNERASYYARLPQGSTIQGVSDAVCVKEFTFPFGKKHRFSAYFFDLYEYVRLFGRHRRFCYLFGDVDYETPVPAFVKSRPITEGTTRSVVCKLNRMRHFAFVNDVLPFGCKQNKILFRNVVRKQPQRTKLIKMYHNHPMCDIGRINDDVDDGHPEYVKPYMSIDMQLGYKFICCIEGHDVATNLKWVMSSNSLAVMPRPKIESWFMEGRLIGDYHYVEIKDDYSDLIEKTSYYMTHQAEAEAIISHAHEYVRQFQNEKVEQYTSYAVIKRYFDVTSGSSQDNE